MCDDHYSSGSGYTCRNCQGASKRKAQTLGIIAVIALAGFVGFVVFYLVEDEKGRKTSFVNRRIAPNLRRLADLFKIVLVVWQIITQVRAKKRRKGTVSSIFLRSCRLLKQALLAIVE